MTAEYLQEGKNWDYTNETEETIAAGTVIMLGDVASVAATNIEPEETGAVATTGVWEIPADGSEFAQGDTVYYDESADAATATESTAVLGVCVYAAAADDTTVAVRLNG